MWGHHPPRWGGAEFLLWFSRWGLLLGSGSSRSRRTRGSSCGNREQESVKQVVARFHWADSWVWMSQLCKNEPFFLSSFGHHVCTCVCGHWCALVLWCITSPHSQHTHTHTHTGPCRGLCIIFLSPVRFYKSPSLSEAIWGSISCVLDSIMSTLLIWTYLVLIKS